MLRNCFTTIQIRLMILNSQERQKLVNAIYFADVPVHCSLFLRPCSFILSSCYKEQPNNRASHNWSCNDDERLFFALFGERDANCWTCSRWFQQIQLLQITRTSQQHPSIIKWECTMIIQLFSKSVPSTNNILFIIVYNEQRNTLLCYESSKIFVETFQTEHNLQELFSIFGQLFFAFTDKSHAKFTI